jgi:hypothetical protein
MVMKKASGGDSPLRQGAWKSFLDPANLASMTVAACSMFRGKLIGALGFPRRGEYIGGRAASGGGQVAPPPGGAGQGLAAPPYGVAVPWLPSVSALDSVSCLEK